MSQLVRVLLDLRPSRASRAPDRNRSIGRFFPHSVGMVLVATIVATTMAFAGPPFVGGAPAEAQTSGVVGVTVRKVVIGEEPTPGFAYPMTIACSTTRSAFVQAITTDPAVPVGSLIVNGAGTWIVVGGVRYFDVRTTSGLSGGDLIGNAANVTANLTAINLALPSALVTLPLPPVSAFNGGKGFDGSFTLTGTGFTTGRSFGMAEFPDLRPTSVCEVRETDNLGGATSYASSTTNDDGSVGRPVPGVQTTAGFRSALTPQGQSITVTDSFAGALAISVAVTGNPGSALTNFQISVICDGGPNDTFVLRGGQTKVYENLNGGTNCAVTENRADGALVTYTDNSGIPSDGRITIRGPGSCRAIGSIPAVVRAEPSAVAPFDACTTQVIITNTYNTPAASPAPVAAVPIAVPVAASSSVVAPAPSVVPTAGATSETATDSPAVSARPATAVDATPDFTG